MVVNAGKTANSLSTRLARDVYYFLKRSVWYFADSAATSGRPLNDHVGHRGGGTIAVSFFLTATAMFCIVRGTALHTTAFLIYFYRRFQSAFCSIDGGFFPSWPSLTVLSVLFSARNITVSTSRFLLTLLGRSVGGPSLARVGRRVDRW